ncbi:terminase large subunit domain-containing protein [Halorubrum sp. HHNYT27]|uniref:terminase large subunit domain-containing protein n=1 Tax=Halorubrum sp. HHNYT27 TaxID=3402275 RepID=UPI003EBFD222
MSAAASTTVEYQWTNYQAHVRDTLEAGDVDLVVLRTGYGGGKSRCGGQWIHRGAIADTEGVGESLVLAQDYQKGKSTTYSVFFKILPGQDTNPFKDGDPENSPIVDTWHSNDKRLVYVTGHVAWLGGADKWNRFAGGEYCRIWCDEVGHYPPNTDLYDLHEMLITRQRTEIGPNTTLWTSTGNGFNQFYDITERQVDADEQPLPWADRMEVIVASTEHNTLLPPDGLDKIRRQFKGTAREDQGLHGGFAAAEGLVYEGITRQQHVIPDGEAHDRVDDWRMYGYDAGWKDPRVLLDIGRTPHGQLVVVDMLYQSGIHVGDPADPNKGTALDWLVGRPNGKVYCEHAPADIDAFRKAGWPAVKAEKDIDGGIDHVRERLETDDGRPGLLVAESCVPLIQEFLSYKEDDVGGSDVDDHALDALRYAVFTESVRSGDGGGSSFARSF